MHYLNNILCSLTFIVIASHFNIYSNGSYNTIDTTRLEMEIQFAKNPINSDTADSTALQRKSTIDNLEMANTQNAIEALAYILRNDPYTSIRAAAGSALCSKRFSHIAIPALNGGLGDPALPVRLYSAVSLACLRAENDLAVNIIIKVAEGVDEENWNVYGFDTKDNFLKYGEETIRDIRNSWRAAAIRALGKIGNAVSKKTLNELEKKEKNDKLIAAIKNARSK